LPRAKTLRQLPTKVVGTTKNREKRTTPSIPGVGKRRLWKARYGGVGIVCRKQIIFCGQALVESAALYHTRGKCSKMICFSDG